MWLPIYIVHRIVCRLLQEEEWASQCSTLSQIELVDFKTNKNGKTIIESWASPSWAATWKRGGVQKYKPYYQYPQGYKHVLRFELFSLCSFWRRVLHHDQVWWPIFLDKFVIVFMHVLIVLLNLTQAARVWVLCLRIAWVKKCQDKKHS